MNLQASMSMRNISEIGCWLLPIWLNKDLGESLSARNYEGPLFRE